MNNVDNWASHMAYRCHSPTYCVPMTRQVLAKGLGFRGFGVPRVRKENNPQMGGFCKLGFRAQVLTSESPIIITRCMFEHIMGPLLLMETAFKRDFRFTACPWNVAASDVLRKGVVLFADMRLSYAEDMAKS